MTSADYHADRSRPQHITAAQNSPEWHAARLGRLTASTAADLLTAKLAVTDNATSRALCNRIAMERSTGQTEDKFETFAMTRGHEMEPVAKAYYSEHIAPVTDCGLFVSELAPGITVGASPDGLVGDDGLVEVKTRSHRYHFETILSGAVPAEYLPQIQTQLLVTGRAWVDFISFCPGLPLFVKRVYPDAAFQAVLIEAFTKAEERIGQTVADYLQAAANLIPTEPIDETGNDLTGFDEQS